MRYVVTVAFALALSGIARADITSIPGLNTCSVVAVEMVDSVDSSTALPGDFFRFETINAVTVKDKIVIPARTMGYGVVAVASSAGRNGRAGALVLEPRYLDLPDHVRLGVVLDHNAGGLQANGTTGAAPGYLGALPVPFLGAAVGIFNYFRHGKDILVPKGTVFSIFPAEGPQTEHCQLHPEL